MRHTILIAAALALALALSAAACTPAAAPPPDAPAPSSTPAEASAARRTWESRRPAAYAYTLEISCFCVHRGAYAVEVRDGRITSARDAATGAPARESQVEWLLTVDALFEAMRMASSAGTPVRAVFDPAQGYPTEVEIGMLANDSGTLYRITHLRAL
ncbi:DUF6174 domain-containing protein [Longimicrobium sp.]|uniref:DUF6174 domain-containing protein n=1 Tax=Longimicrobium sp. TaxID=2029185 RepID=UPI002E353A30|nr:DUF6174 domain-containing protein [Longimicrobium sp.]HEX6042022.1 DUF6174 domain-containing protein [Longimicrobium sp.]